jgi:hypothetical protein
METLLQISEEVFFFTATVFMALSGIFIIICITVLIMVATFFKRLPEEVRKAVRHQKHVFMERFSFLELSNRFFKKNNEKDEFEDILNL